LAAANLPGAIAHARHSQGEHGDGNERPAGSFIVGRGEWEHSRLTQK